MTIYKIELFTNQPTSELGINEQKQVFQPGFLASINQKRLFSGSQPLTVEQAMIVFDRQEIDIPVLENPREYVIEYVNSLYGKNELVKFYKA